MSTRVEREHRAARDELADLVLDDPGLEEPACIVLVTEAGARVVRDAIAVDLPAARNVPFSDAYAAPRWSLLLVHAARTVEDVPLSTWANGARLCAASSTFRDAIFAAWQLGGLRGVRALVLAPDGG